MHFASIMDGIELILSILHFSLSFYLSICMPIYYLLSLYFQHRLPTYWIVHLSVYIHIYIRVYMYIYVFSLWYPFTSGYLRLCNFPRRALTRAQTALCCYIHRVARDWRNANFCKCHVSHDGPLRVWKTKFKKKIKKKKIKQHSRIRTIVKTKLI